MQTFDITSAKLTPRSVTTSEPFVISIGFQELVTWLLDRNEAFLVDTNMNYLLSGDEGGSYGNRETNTNNGSNSNNIR